jgi:hypothetical protein
VEKVLMEEIVLSFDRLASCDSALYLSGSFKLIEFHKVSLP